MYVKRPASALNILLPFHMKPAVGAALTLMSSFCFAHSGGLDSDGGHTDHSTGLYHCHREPCFSLYGDTVGQLGDDTESAPFVTLYDRDDWPHWMDADGDCQDTRAEVLIEASRGIVTFREQAACNVSTGLWRDSYTGQEHRRARELEIDHLVPLRWAHGHGGDRWTRRQKETFANDMSNLVPTAAAVNAEKGAKGPDAWLPPLVSYRCEYLERFVGIVGKYGLQFVEVEREALAGELVKCGID